MQIEKNLICTDCFKKIDVSLCYKNIYHCNNCKKKISINNNFFNFEIIKIDTKFDKIAKSTWGKNLHHAKLKKNNEFIHSKIFIDLFSSKNLNLFRGDLLEIGSGRGNDLKHIIKNFNVNSYTALDLGDNLENLSKLFVDNKKIKFLKCNCLKLPFENNTFEIVYSYGVFHHTEDPKKAISESIRVLKQDGTLIFYVYTNHESNFLKNKLIILEKIIVRFFNLLPNFISKSIIIFLFIPLSYIMLVFPSIILRFFKFIEFANKFPLSFTCSFYEIYHNLQDRFLAPINYRFSRKELFSILGKYNLKETKIISLDSGEKSGHYIYAIK